MEVSGDWSETSFIVNVENNGSYHILNEGEEEQPADSQGSVVISGSSTRTTFEDNPMSPMSEYYRDSLAADSAHNTAHECLEVPVDKTHVVKVQYLTRMTNKRTIKEIEAINKYFEECNLLIGDLNLSHRIESDKEIQIHYRDEKVKVLKVVEELTMDDIVFQ